MKYLWTFLILSFAMTAHAAPRVNSGGGGWACRKNDGSGQVLWIKAADLTKVEFITPGYLQELPGNRWKILQAEHARIARQVPALAILLQAYPFDIANNLIEIPDALNFIPDAELRYKPPGSSCPGGLVSYVQLADTTMDGKVIFSSRVWNLPEFSEFHKAAILLHEQIYFALRTALGDESSYRTRQLMGLIYSNMDQDILRRAVDEVLRAKPRARPGIFGFENVPALFSVDLQCAVTFNTDVTYLWKPTIPGDSLDITQNGLNFKVTTSTTDSSLQSLEVYDTTSGLSALLDKTQTVLTFNALRRASVQLKQNENSIAQIHCESNSPLDRDPL